MVGKSVNKYSNIHADIANSTVTQIHEQPLAYDYSPIEIGTLICFMVGVIQVKFRKYFESDLD
jgi:hypothetical protein